MPMTSDNQRTQEEGLHNHWPVAAGATIYAGAAVGQTPGGHARPLVAGDKFLGFAREKAVNATGAAGDVKVWLSNAGKFLCNIPGGIALTDYGAPIYATDDNTFTKTAAGASFVGKLVRYENSTTGVVNISPNAVASA